MGTSLLVNRANDLNVAALLEVADGRRLELGRELRELISARRDEVLQRLEVGEAVYGVNTGMGAASDVRLDEAAQSAQQGTLMLARSVGSAPWLSTVQARAVMAVRLRTFLTLDAGVSVELCLRLVDLLNLDLCPAIPASGHGTAGEIVPLAHLGGAITGSGEFIGAAPSRNTAPSGNEGPSSIEAPAWAGMPGTRPASASLAAARLVPFRLGPKEGVAMIEGVPVTTALALLTARDAFSVAEQASAALAAELALVGANRDPFQPELARSDRELELVLSAVRGLAGPEPKPRALQSPTSFRVAPPAIAHLLRSVAAVEQAAGRALTGVTDSPAYIDGRFVGTAGFDGFDLAAALDALRVAVIHLAETSTARVHRLLDPRVTGLPRQLSDRPGLHAGMVVVHKRAVGVTHAMVSGSRPVSLGAVETSLGQEDVQSFSVDAAMACGHAIAGARDVLACELLAVTHGIRLSAAAGVGAAPGPTSTALGDLLDQVSGVVAPGTADRPFGRDVARLAALLANGWADGVLREQPSTREG